MGRAIVSTASNDHVERLCEDLFDIADSIGNVDNVAESKYGTEAWDEWVAQLLSSKEVG